MIELCLSVTPSDCTQIKWLLSANLCSPTFPDTFWPRDEGSKVDGPTLTSATLQSVRKVRIWNWLMHNMYYSTLTGPLELHSGTFHRHPKCTPLENQLGYLGSLSKWYNMIELISAWQVHLFHLPVPVHLYCFSFFSYMVFYNLKNIVNIIIPQSPSLEIISKEPSYSTATLWLGQL